MAIKCTMAGSYYRTGAFLLTNKISAGGFSFQASRESVIADSQQQFMYSL